MNFLEPAPLIKDFRKATKSAVEYVKKVQKKIMVTPDEIWSCETEKELRELLSGLTMKKIRQAVELCGVHTTTRMRKAELIDHSVKEIMRMKTEQKKEQQATQMKQYALKKKLVWYERELTKKLKQAEFLSLQLKKILAMGGSNSEVYKVMQAKSLKLTSELLQYRKDFDELKKVA